MASLTLLLRLAAAAALDSSASQRSLSASARLFAWINCADLVARSFRICSSADAAIDAFVSVKLETDDGAVNWESESRSGEVPSGVFGVDFGVSAVSA